MTSQKSNNTTDFSAHQQFSTVAGELSLGKHTISALAKSAGQTPFYVYHKDSLDHRIKLLRQALPKKIELHYAIKSNPMPELIKHLLPLVDGFDVASAGELKVSLEAGVTADKMSFAGPGKSLAELELAISNDVLINCESITELERISSISQRQNTKARIALRVNPDFTLKSSGMKMGGGPQQFGIDAETIPEVLALLPDLAVEFIGFHIFSGSQNLQAESLIDCQTKTIELALKLSQLAPTKPKLINIGGGFGIPYFKGEKELDIKAVGINLQQQIDLFQQNYPDCKIALELGRYISGPAGLYVCEVTDIKVSRGKKYLISNGGLHHHLAASGNFGQIIRKNYPVAIATKMASEELEEVSIVGPLCTPLDLLAEKMLLPKAEIGDLVAIYQSGAYGFSASPGRFLNHPEVIELIV